MILWQWLGEYGAVVPGYVVTSGTGQSGTVALTTSTGEVLTLANALKYTQQTSSGDGTVTMDVRIPRPLGARKMRITVDFLIPIADADFDRFMIRYYDYHPTIYYYYGLRQESNAGATEEIQYLNSAGAWVDTGFGYPSDQYKEWSRIQFTIDLGENKTTSMAFGSEFDLTSRDAAYGAGAFVPGQTIAMLFAGGTTAAEMFVDKIIIDVQE